jgi:hypothetical protein
MPPTENDFICVNKTYDMYRIKSLTNSNVCIGDRFKKIHETEGIVMHVDVNSNIKTHPSMPVWVKFKTKYKGNYGNGDGSIMPGDLLVRY